MGRDRKPSLGISIPSRLQISNKSSKHVAAKLKWCLGNVDKRYRNMPVVDSPCATPDHPNVFNAFQGYSYTKPSAFRKSVRPDAIYASNCIVGRWVGLLLSWRILIFLCIHYHFVGKDVLVLSITHWTPQRWKVQLLRMIHRAIHTFSKYSSDL